MSLTRRRGPATSGTIGPYGGTFLVKREGLVAAGLNVYSELRDNYHAIYPRSLGNAARSDFVGVANSIELFMGRETGVAKLLLSTDAVTSIYSPTPAKHVAVHGAQADLSGAGANGESTGPTGIGIGTMFSMPMFLADSPICVSRGISGGVYLCTFLCPKYLYGMTAVNRAYNLKMLSGTYSITDDVQTDENYMEATLNAGVPWTIQEVLEDLLAQMPTEWVGLGYRPNSIDFSGVDPTVLSRECGGCRFHGVDVWTAINDIAEAYFLQFCLDPAGSSALRLRLYSQTVPVDHFANNQIVAIRNAHYLSPIKSILYDTGAFHGNAVSIPETIRVFSPSPMARGAEQSALRDINDTANPVWVYDYATNDSSAIVGTVLPIYDFTAVELKTPRNTYSAIVDADYELGVGTPAAQIDRAEEVAENFYNQIKLSIYAQTVVTTGLGAYQSMRPGVTSLCYRDYGDGAGPVTEVKSDPSKYPALKRYRLQESYLKDSMLRPMINMVLTRQDFEATQAVQVYDAEQDMNKRLTYSAVGYYERAFPGRILKPVGVNDDLTDTTGEWEKCYITVIYGGDVVTSTDEHGVGKPLDYIRNGYMGLGRLVGTCEKTTTEESVTTVTTYPHYVIYHNYTQCAQAITFYVAVDFDETDATFEARVKTAYSGSDPSIGVTPTGSETTGRITITNTAEDESTPSVYGFTGTAGQVGFAVYDYLTDTYLCLQIFC